MQLSNTDTGSFRTLGEIHADSAGSPTVRGLVRVLHEKFQLRASYALLEYEAGQEGRLESSQMFRALGRTESEQIEQLIGCLGRELRTVNPND